MLTLVVCILYSVSREKSSTCIIESMIVGDEADGTGLFGLWV
jgi:hypothetical protein